MNLTQLANEHREAVAKGKTSLDFWGWLRAVKGAKGNSTLEIEASLLGVTLDREPEPEPEDFEPAYTGKKLAIDVDDEPLCPDFDLPPGASIDKLTKDYHAALESGAWQQKVRAGDLWFFIADRHPPKGAASTSGAVDRDEHGWAEVWAQVNAEARMSRPGKSSGDVPRIQTTAPLDAKPAQDKWPAATLSPEDVMAAVNAENRQK